MSDLAMKKVDQALFGYSDGHRQIAASIRLPSKDQYQLATASDLAAGTHLAGDESYLTGLPLLESKRFALIRTWAAPEMPRPGCVWSHVLLVDFQLLGSLSDVSILLPLLRRPRDSTHDAYAKQISLLSGPRRDFEPSESILCDFISAYYAGQPVLFSLDLAEEQVESAIMAAWSQQWPRLRQSLSFQTAIAGDRRRSDALNFDVQIGGGGGVMGSTIEQWVSFAAADAATQSVTPLRRFLWRYGRDLQSPRKQFHTLVKLYMMSEGRSELPLEYAAQLLEALPNSGDGEVLKRDILGFSTGTPSLLPSLSTTGLLELLASGSLVSITEDEMRRHFATLPADQVSSIARLADEGKEKLGKWDDLISEVFVSIADRAALIGELPDRLRIRVLDHRPELIDRDTASRLPNDALVSLARKHTADDRSREIANALVRRDFGYASSQLFGIMPLQVFAEAIPEAMKGQLAPSWETAIRDNYQTVLTSSWPAEAKRSSEVAWGLSLMGYPSQADRTASFWSDLLDHVEDDVIGEQRMRFQAFLLRSALNDLSPASWKLATRTLPELRPLILENKLPSDVRRMLASELPRFNTAGYWNIDKRVLLSLSRLMHAHSDEKALNSLGLNDRDMATVIFGMDEEEKYSERRSWWW